MRLSSILRKLRGAGELLELPKRWSEAQGAAKGDFHHTKVLTGTLLSRLNAQRSDVGSLREVEFQVFSQFGDDGIIQYLIHHLPIAERTFIEFGVEDYIESNTRFLLVNNKWSGLVMDGSKANIAYIERDPISLFYDVTPRRAFITAENIDDLIVEAGFGGRIGLLSIDIDGVDYWVWDKITAVDPAIVVAEYNASFGPERAITVPYDPGFTRAKAHHSRLYWGASLAALQHLAQRKGYVFVGCNANGNNAYFVRREWSELPAIARLQRGFVPASFAEYAVDGRRVRGPAVYETIRGLPVVNVISGQTEPL